MVLLPSRVNYIFNFYRSFDIDKYHEEVTTYEVTDEKSELVAIFYADFFPKGKKTNGVG
jgi:peptidyl-dipeptidase Dcp